MTAASLLAAPAPPEEPAPSGDTHDPAPDDAGPPAGDAPPQDDALAHLAHSHELRAAGDLDGAIEAAGAAITADPELAAGYLARAQLRIDAVGASVPTEAEAGAVYVATLSAAADDLDRYLELAEVRGPARAALEAERYRLRRDADQWRPAPPKPEPVAVVDVPEPRPVAPAPKPSSDRETSRRGGPTLVLVGGLATAAGVGLAASSFRIRQRCDGLCDVGWEARTAPLAPASVATVVGAVLVPWGAARLVSAHPPTPRVRRAVGGSLLGIGGAALATGVSLLAIAGARWRSTVPSDGGELSSTQSLANAGAALVSAAPAALGAGLVTLVLRSRARDAMAARRPPR